MEFDENRTAKQDPTIRIRKYENRRLYSTAHRRHLTIEEVAALVRQGSVIEVTDATTGKDLTSEILMQILIEQGRAPELPSTFLLQMIRQQDAALRGEFSRWLGSVMEFYAGAGREMARAYSQVSPLRMLFGAFPWSATRDEAGPVATGGARDPEIARLADELRRAQETIGILEQKLQKPAAVRAAPAQNKNSASAKRAKARKKKNS